MPNFIAHVTFLRKKDGGRDSPVHSNYRPHLSFDNDVTNYKTSARHIFIGQGIVKLGVSAKAEITLLSGDYKYKVGEGFKTYEGPKQIGYGVVQKLIKDD